MAGIVNPIIVGNTSAEVQLATYNVLGTFLLTIPGAMVGSELYGTILKKAGLASTLTLRLKAGLASTLTLRLKVGALVLAAAVLSFPAAGPTRGALTVRARSTVRVTGITGTVIGGIDCSESLTPAFWGDDPSTLQVLNTQVVNAFTVTAQWSVADAANILRIEQGFIGIPLSGPDVL